MNKKVYAIAMVIALVIASGEADNLAIQLLYSMTGIAVAIYCFRKLESR